MTAVFVAAPAHSYQVEPLIKTIEPSGAGSTMRIKITNTNASAVSLELSGLRVTTDESGKVNREEDLEDLMVFPMQTSIPTGKSQIVQVRYVGDQDLDKGRVYAVKIEQLPVEIGGGKGEVTSQVKIGLTFLSHILVQSNSAAPELVFSEIEKRDNGELSITVDNIGTGTALLKEMNWSLVDSNNQTSSVGIEHFELGGFGAQIPGAPKRVITINADALSDIGQVTKVVAVPDGK